MGKKWIEGLMILAALWAMTGCGKQEMIRCEYTNETAGFTLSFRKGGLRPRQRKPVPTRESGFIRMIARRAVSIFVTVFLLIMQGMKIIWRPWK